MNCMVVHIFTPDILVHVRKNVALCTHQEYPSAGLFHAIRFKPTLDCTSINSYPWSLPLDVPANCRWVLEINGAVFSWEVGIFPQRAAVQILSFDTVKRHDVCLTTRLVLVI